jgi:hypothetical protein
MAMSHDNLLNYMKTNFALIQYHKYSIGDIERLMPFEREIYVSLLIMHLKEEKERIERNKRK